MEELDALEQLLPLCKRTLYETAKAKIEAGVAHSRLDAARQIADETGKPIETIRRAIYRHEDFVTLSQPCETDLQADPTPPPICMFWSACRSGLIGRMAHKKSRTRRPGSL
jgi:hypothetical protein